MTDSPPIREMATGTAEQGMIKLAAREDLLAGNTDADKLAHAKRLGLAGVEVWADGLRARVPSLCDALKNTDVRVSTVHMGYAGGFLHPDEATRQVALDNLRHTMTYAVDIGAEGVVLVPHIGPLELPNLMPYKASIQLAVELMVMHLRSFSDLAYVFDINLYLAPLNRYETAFLTRLDQGALLRKRIKDHAHVLLAPDTAHMAVSEDDPLTALMEHRRHIGHVTLTEPTGKLPGTGNTDFAAVAQTLKDIEGWAVIACGTPDDMPHPRDLANSVQAMRNAGFVD